VFTRDQPPGLSGAAVTQGTHMQDEAEEPIIETNGDKPTRAEILLVGATLALLVVSVLAALRIWSGGSH
jgi:uncharacterized protein involved in exopolysaccharide biosynthesis